MNSESWGCEEAVSALAHYIQDKEITKVMVLTFLDGSMENSQLFFLSLHPFVCHDDEMTLGSGSFSGISQQLPKRW